ncbi:MAG: GNAT family N-acetyltransferase [Paracoccaceae bacterium]
MSDVTLTQMPTGLVAPKWEVLADEAVQPALFRPIDDPFEARRHVIVGAMEGDTPLGLAVARQMGGNSLRLDWIAVEASRRRQGLGRRLLRRCERLGQKRGLGWIHATYSSRDDREAFAGLLANAGWSAPELVEYRNAGYSGDMDRLGPGWRAFVARVERQGFTVTPLAEISDEDRRRALEIETEQVGPRAAGYSRYLRQMDPAISLAIREHGVFQGWVIGVSRPGAGYHRYISGFVAGHLQRSGWLIAALDKVMRLQAEVYGPKSVALQEASVEYPEMMAFMKRRLTPYALWTEDVFLCDKRLPPGPAG